MYNAWTYTFFEHLSHSYWLSTNDVPCVFQRWNTWGNKTDLPACLYLTYGNNRINKLDGVLQGVSAVLKETGPGSQWMKLLIVLCHAPLSRPNEVDHITKKADR